MNVNLMRQLWLSLHVQGNHIRRLAVLTMLCVTGGYVLSCHGYENQVARADDTERILMTPLHVADKDTQVYHEYLLALVHIREVHMSA